MVDVLNCHFTTASNKILDLENEEDIALQAQLNVTLDGKKMLPYGVAQHLV